MKADHGCVPQKSSGREPALGEIGEEEEIRSPAGGEGSGWVQRRGAGQGI